VDRCRRCCRFSCRERGGQRALQGVKDELVDAARVAKAHFGLGRMHIDIDAGRVEFEEQDVGRVALAVQDVGPGLACGVRQQLVADEAAIDEEVLLVAPGARIGRQRGEPRQSQRPGAGVERARMGEELVADDFPRAARKVGAGETALDAAVVAQREGDLGPRQRHAPQHFVAVRVFGRFRLEKFASRRGVVVEIGDLDHRAGGECGGLDVGGIAAQTEGMRLRRMTTRNRDPRDGCNRGQRLAAKSVAGDAFEVIEAGDLARRMPAQCQRQVVGRDAAAVVGDADQAHAAFFELHVDLRGAGVEAVFQQFLEHRGRALHHLAGRDLADQQVRQRLDDSHGSDYSFR
jgi:hypothetical protein